MLKDDGFSFVESLLTIVIIFTIVGTLIPVSYQLKSTLYNKLLELHASQIAFEAAKMVLNNRTSSGTKTVDQVEYYWDFDGTKICVEFNNLDEVRNKCINQEGEVR